jgi:Domain of unknown function (DUF5655)
MRHHRVMPRWTCPVCEREFGRTHQAHVCLPGCTVEECFAGRPPAYRDMYDAVVAHVRTLGPVHADAVSVGVFLKRGRTLVEIRPMARSLNLYIVLPRAVHDARIARTLRASAERFAHLVKLTDPRDVDEQVRDWLSEAYLAAGA